MDKRRKIKKGDKIKIFDSCINKDVIEEVLRVEKSPDIYKTRYIYSLRKSWHRLYDERLSTPNEIKELYSKN